MLDLRLDLGERRHGAGLHRRERLDQVVAELGLDRGRRAGSSSSENAALSNGATVWPRGTVSLPPLSFEPGSSEYSFASVAKSAPDSSCEWISSASAFVLTRMCRTSRDSATEYWRLVLVVVLLELGVGHLDVLGEALVDLLREQLRGEVLAQRGDGVALLLQPGLELLLVVLRSTAS